MKRGNRLWEEGLKDEAFSEWKVNFEIHWGSHAADALRALHEVNFSSAEEVE